MLNLKKLTTALFAVVFSIGSDFDRIAEEEDRINRRTFCRVIQVPLWMEIGYL
jgi:hypothetical protein